MSRLLRSLSCSLCLFVAIAAGCYGSKSGASAAKAPAANDGVSATTGQEQGGGKKIVPIDRDPQSLEGNWVMVLTIEGRDKYVWIVRLSKGADGRVGGEFVDATKDSLKPQIVETTVEDSLVKLKIKNSKGTIDFEGQFDGHAIRGTLANGIQELYQARLLSTGATSLATYVDEAGPPGSDVFQKAVMAMGQQPNLKEIVRIAGENRISPVSVDVLARMLANQSKFQLTDEELTETVEEYLRCAKPWGPRMAVKAELHSAECLVTFGRLPEVALKHLARAEELHTEKSDVVLRHTASLRVAAEIQINLRKSRSEAEADRAEAHVALEKLLAAQPYNPEVLLALATRCQATQQTDAAIAYYSDILALPLLEPYLMSLRAGQPAGDPTPRDQLKKLWIERHGDDTGMEQHVAGIHRTKIDALIREIREKSPATTPAEPGDHTVLVELFTSAHASGCVASDLAATAISAEYPVTDLVVLRYHQHVPGPDGMANQDAEDRFTYYEGAGIPTVAVDGLVLDSNQIPYAGPVQFTGTAYNMIRQVIDRRRLQSTPIRLQLEAAVTEGQLSIHASVTGVTEEQLPMLRLRLALAEDAVESVMPNGIRRHEMLVREMPGGARGTAPKKGELKYDYTMPVADLQLHLDEYIQRFEAGNKLKFPDEMKPPIRGRFHLVGWVQNMTDKADQKNPNKLILQTATVPVEGLGPVADTSSAAPQQNAVAPAGTSTTPPAPALPE